MVEERCSLEVSAQVVADAPGGGRVTERVDAQAAPARDGRSRLSPSRWETTGRTLSTGRGSIPDLQPSWLKRAKKQNVWQKAGRKDAEPIASADTGAPRPPRPPSQQTEPLKSQDSRVGLKHEQFPRDVSKTNDGDTQTL